MLRKIRIVAALLFFAGVTLLFLDFTGALHAWLGWMAKVQLLPALLALNVGVVAALVALTLLFGRVYCSVVCPLGVMQDLFAWAGRRRKRNRYAYSPARKWLRCGLLALFIAAMAANAAGLAALIAPYSAYGRIVQNLFAPLWGWANNALAYLAERVDSYAFYTTEVWVRSWSVFAVAAATLAVVGVLAWRNGRTWCNTVCPVGTFLGFLSKYSLFRPVIDTSKCNGCTLCARNCKAACIDAKNHRIDYSRCVACMDCIDNCRQGPSPMLRGGVRQSGPPGPSKLSDRSGPPRLKQPGRRGAPEPPVRRAAVFWASWAYWPGRGSGRRRKRSTAALRPSPASGFPAVPRGSRLPDRSGCGIWPPTVRAASSASRPVPIRCCARRAAR